MKFAPLNLLFKLIFWWFQIKSILLRKITQKLRINVRQDYCITPPYVKLLVDTSRFIASRIKDGTIVLVDKEIVGDLNFTRYEKE